MRPDLRLIEIIYTGAEVAANCLVLGDQVVQKVPGVSWVRGRVLDTLLGPEDDFDCVSRTSSNSHFVD